MRALIDQIASDHHGELQVTEDTWFNGHAYFPRYTFSIAFQSGEWDHTVRCEWLTNDFSKRNDAIGAMGDIVIWRLNATSPKIFGYQGFSLKRLSWWKRLTTKTEYGFSGRLPQQLKNDLQQEIQDITSLLFFPIERIQADLSSSPVNIKTEFSNLYLEDDTIRKIIDIFKSICSKIDA